MQALNTVEQWSSQLYASEPARLVYNPEDCLMPDLVTDSIAHATAMTLKTAFPEEPLHLLELGIGCAPFLSLTSHHLYRQSVFLEGVDIEAAVLPYAQRNLTSTIEYRQNPEDSFSYRLEPWQLTVEALSVASQLERPHAIGFNPPYLPLDHQVRQEYQAMPPNSMFVPGSVDGLDHYHELMPADQAKVGLRDTVRNNGIVAIRVPRDSAAAEAVYDIARIHFRTTEERPYTFHWVNVAGELDERNGDGLLVQAAKVEPRRYVTGLLRCMGMWTWSTALSEPYVTYSGSIADVEISPTSPSGRR